MKKTVARKAFAAASALIMCGNTGICRREHGQHNNTSIRG